jgi:hypothetical protein
VKALAPGEDEQGAQCGDEPVANGVKDAGHGRRACAAVWVGATNLRGWRREGTLPLRMRFSAWLTCALAVLVVTGCAKKSSKEFHRLSSDQEVLVLREGDDAWVSAEMAAIQAGLEQVPENAIEHDRALALVEKLKSERARVEREKAEAAAPAPSAQPSPPPPPPPEQPAGAPAAEPLAAAPAVDGGAPPAAQPWLGMPEAEFSKRFGACVSAGPKTKLSSGADADAVYAVNATAECQQQLGGAQAGGRTIFLFGPKGLAEKATFVKETIDGGQVVTPGFQPPTPDPGPPPLTIPGAPLPEGVDAGGIVPLP